MLSVAGGFAGAGAWNGLFATASTETLASGSGTRNTRGGADGESPGRPLAARIEALERAARRSGARSPRSKASPNAAPGVSAGLLTEMEARVAALEARLAVGGAGLSPPAVPSDPRAIQNRLEQIGGITEQIEELADWWNYAHDPATNWTWQEATALRTVLLTGDHSGLDRKGQFSQLIAALGGARRFTRALAAIRRFGPTSGFDAVELVTIEAWIHVRAHDWESLIGCVKRAQALPECDSERREELEDGLADTLFYYGPEQLARPRLEQWFQREQRQADGRPGFVLEKIVNCAFAQGDLTGARDWINRAESLGQAKRITAYQIKRWREQLAELKEAAAGG